LRSCGNGINVQGLEKQFVASEENERATGKRRKEVESERKRTKGKRGE
jgi:hypothetical protein